MEPEQRREVFRLQGYSARLQSIRGVAALCVAVGHAFAVSVHGRIEDPNFTLRPTNALLTACEVLIQPNTAVILFYVLSGFVLAESWRRDHASLAPRHLLSFGARRLCRLVPVMWISIILATVVAVAFRHGPYAGTTAWFDAQLDKSIAPDTLLANFLGLSHSINSVLWSVQIELAMIVLLPVLTQISTRCTLSVDLGIFGALCAIKILFWAALPNFVLFAYCFYLGILLPKLISFAPAARILGDGRVLLVSLALLGPIDLLFVSGHLWMVYKFVANAAISAHLIAFLMLRPDVRAARFLDRPTLIHLGNVSYSCYCYAMPLLIVAASLALWAVPAAWIVSDLVATAVTLVAGLACVALSWALGHVSFVWVERPGMRIGRRWSEMLEGCAWPPAVGKAASPNKHIDRPRSILATHRLRAGTERRDASPNHSPS